MIDYNSGNLLELARAFYTLTGMRMSLLDPDAKEFFAYPNEKSLFCSIVRSNPLINKNCIQCDLEHFQKCKKLKTPLIYTCHLGLTEVIAPVKENNIIICYCMFGQIVMNEFKEQYRTSIYENIKEQGFEESEILNAINNLRCVKSTKLEATVKILETILTYIFSTKLITLTKTQFINRLNSYIDSHISESIHIDDLANYFNISRTHLYELAKPYIDCGISDYVILRKISHAQTFLKNPGIRITDLAEKVGFTDYNYFTRVFKKKTGLSPRDYRKQQRNL